jgi:hypothetical protein
MMVQARPPAPARKRMEPVRKIARDLSDTDLRPRQSGTGV